MHFVVCCSMYCDSPTQYCSEDVLQAVQERNGMDMLTALVETGANINLPGQDGSYPIHLAVAGGQHETVLFLLNKGAKVDKHRRVLFLHRIFIVFTYEHFAHRMA